MRKRVVCFGASWVGLTLLSGCMHGETFGEWKGQLLDSDPWTVQPVEPNDSAVDETNREFLQEVRALKEKRGKFQREARPMPSQNVTAFMNSSRTGGREANRRLLVSFAGKLTSSFSGIRDFKIIGTEDETLAQLSSPTIGVPSEGNTAYLLSYNILSLSTRRVVKTLLGAQVSVNGQTQYCYVGEMSASLALLDPKGSQRMSISASVSIPSNGPETEEMAEQSLIDAAVADIVRQYMERTAPPAYVSQMRGNGLFAEITLGSDYGVTPGTLIEFYQNVKAEDLVSGKPIVKKTVVATGKVAEGRFVSGNASWVKVDCHHYRKVHLGTFARVMKTTND